MPLSAASKGGHGEELRWLPSMRAIFRCLVGVFRPWASLAQLIAFAAIGALLFPMWLLPRPELSPCGIRCSIASTAR
jgi:hypothetical protein